MDWRFHRISVVKVGLCSPPEITEQAGLDCIRARDRARDQPMQARHGEAAAAGGKQPAGKLRQVYRFR